MYVNVCYNRRHCGNSASVSSHYLLACLLAGWLAGSLADWLGLRPVAYSIRHIW